MAANVETVHEKAKELFCRSLEHKQKRLSKRLSERIKRRRDSATLCSTRRTSRNRPSALSTPVEGAGAVAL